MLFIEDMSGIYMKNRSVQWTVGKIKVKKVVQKHNIQKQKGDL